MCIVSVFLGGDWRELLLGDETNLGITGLVCSTGWGLPYAVQASLLLLCIQMKNDN
jgi:hypothetical protein